MNCSLESIPIDKKLLERIDANFTEDTRIPTKNRDRVLLCEGLHTRDTEHLIFFECEPVAVPCYNCDHLMILEETKFNEWKKSIQNSNIEYM